MLFSFFLSSNIGLGLRPQRALPRHAEGCRGVRPSVSSASAEVMSLFPWEFFRAQCFIAFFLIFDFFGIHYYSKYCPVI